MEENKKLHIGIDPGIPGKDQTVISAFVQMKMETLLRIISELSSEKGTARDCYR